MEAKTSATYGALTTASATLAVIAGAISVVTAFAYIIAYKYLSRYFATLGCEWAVDLYPPTQLVQTAAPVAVAVAGIAFAVWNNYPTLSQSEPKIRTSLIFLIAAAACYSIHLLIEKFSVPYRSYFNWPAFFLACVAGVIVVAKVVKKLFDAQGIAFGSVILILLIAFEIFIFSGERGKSHAQDVIAHKNGRGQEVKMPDSQTRYRLARIVPYERALIFTESTGGKREFRVVSVTEVSFDTSN